MYLHICNLEIWGTLLYVYKEKVPYLGDKNEKYI